MPSRLLAVYALRRGASACSMPPRISQRHRLSPPRRGIRKECCTLALCTKQASQRRKEAERHHNRGAGTRYKRRQSRLLPSREATMRQSISHLEACSDPQIFFVVALDNVICSLAINTSIDTVVILTCADDTLRRFPAVWTVLSPSIRSVKMLQYQPVTGEEPVTKSIPAEMQGVEDRWRKGRGGVTPKTAPTNGNGIRATWPNRAVDERLRFPVFLSIRANQDHRRPYMTRNASNTSLAPVTKGGVRDISRLRH